MKIIGTLRALDEAHGAVRVEDVYATDIDDLWEACTEPARLSRWIADVTGNLQVGGTFAARFTSGWEGTGRVDVCEPPRRLLVTTQEEGESPEQVIEVTLTAEGERTRLAIEERGLPIDQVAAYGAGWQIHADDLTTYLAEGQRGDSKERWDALIGAYRRLDVGRPRPTRPATGS
ncbi:MAG: SRPBCC family protein [Nocardioides sp.]